jgi:hypothetical protein
MLGYPNAQLLNLRRLLIEYPGQLPDLRDTECRILVTSSLNMDYREELLENHQDFPLRII